MTLKATAARQSVTICVVASLVACGPDSTGGLVAGPPAIQGTTLRPDLDDLVVDSLSPPPPGQYLTIEAKDWSIYPDKEALLGLFGVEGHLNDCALIADQSRCDPHLPATEFYDLVPDSVFGQVIRYNGGPHLNTIATDMPGRIAVHGVNFTPLTNVWVRQFVRFSTNFTTVGLAGGQNAASQKMMFLRYESSALRHAWIIQGPRGMSHETGADQGTSFEHGMLVWNNVRSMNTQYGVGGWPDPDGWPMFRSDVGPQGAPIGPGTGEWYEVVLHHKAVAERGEHTLAWRQYTVNGQVSPQPWSIVAEYEVFTPGQSWKRIMRYEMGVNRNRQWDETMYVYWGPYEVVDGSAFPSPWGLPGY